MKEDVSVSMPQVIYKYPHDHKLYTIYNSNYNNF